jgi:hypothetical protein
MRDLSLRGLIFPVEFPKKNPPASRGISIVAISIVMSFPRNTAAAKMPPRFEGGA